MSSIRFLKAAARASLSSFASWSWTTSGSVVRWFFAPLVAPSKPPVLSLLPPDPDSGMTGEPSGRTGGGEGVATMRPRRFLPLARFLPGRRFVTLLSGLGASTGSHSFGLAFNPKGRATRTPDSGFTIFTSGEFTLTSGSGVMEGMIRLSRAFVSDPPPSE